MQLELSPALAACVLAMPMPGGPLQAAVIRYVQVRYDRHNRYNRHGHSVLSNFLHVILQPEVTMHLCLCIYLMHSSVHAFYAVPLSVRW